jgi:ABC-2 type transport system ATP-binding protein
MIDPGKSASGIQSAFSTTGPDRHDRIRLKPVAPPGRWGKRAERPHVQTAIETHGLSRRFGRETVFGDVDLHVPAGGITALLGRPGAGKTTLLHVLVGLIPPSRGRARVLGLDPVRRGPLVRRRVGFVPGDLALPGWMRVRDHLRLLRPFYPTWSRSEETRLLDLFDVDPKARFRRLSPAGRVKHALVAALAHEPELLLLDEPFPEVDEASRAGILNAVREIVRSDGRTALVGSSAFMRVVGAADRIVHMDEGSIALVGDSRDIIGRTVRLRVTVAVGTEQWEPPGRPLVVRDGKDLLLTYLDPGEHDEEWIRNDPTVLMVRRLSADPTLPERPDDRVEEDEPCGASSP